MPLSAAQRQLMIRPAQQIVLSGAHYLTGTFGARPLETDIVAGRTLGFRNNTDWRELAVHAAEWGGLRCCGRYAVMAGSVEAGRLVRNQYMPPTGDLAVWLREAQAAMQYEHLDLSGQRADPFVPAVLSGADKIIVPITPNIQGVCWFNAVKPFLEAMNAAGRVLPIAAMADRQHDLSVVEKAADMRFIAVLPYVREFRQDDADAGTTPASTRYAKQVQKIFGMLREVKA